MSTKPQPNAPSTGSVTLEVNALSAVVCSDAECLEELTLGGVTKVFPQGGMGLSRRDVHLMTYRSRHSI